MKRRITAAVTAAIMAATMLTLSSCNEVTETATDIAKAEMTSEYIIPDNAATQVVTEVVTNAEGKTEVVTKNIVIADGTTKIITPTTKSAQAAATTNKAQPTTKKAAATTVKNNSSSNNNTPAKTTKKAAATTKKAQSATTKKAAQPTTTVRGMSPEEAKQIAIEYMESKGFKLDTTKTPNNSGWIPPLEWDYKNTLAPDGYESPYEKIYNNIYEACNYTIYTRMGYTDEELKEAIAMLGDAGDFNIVTEYKGDSLTNENWWLYILT